MDVCIKFVDILKIFAASLLASCEAVAMWSIDGLLLPSTVPPTMTSSWLRERASGHSRLDQVTTESVHYLPPIRNLVLDRDCCEILGHSKIKAVTEVRYERCFPIPKHSGLGRHRS